jgi:hypothetical protein
VTPQAALGELLARLAASRGAAVYFSDDDLAGWPDNLVADLKANRLLVRASPAVSAICPGCECECVMPVEVLPDDKRGAAAFIVCDKRGDIGRVVVPIAVLERCKGTGELLADCLSRLLHFEARSQGADTVNRWSLGMLEGKKHKDRLALHAGDGGLTLAVAGHTVALHDVLTFHRQAIRLDRAALVRFVDQPTGKVAVESEPPNARRDRLLERRRQLQAKGVRNFIQVIAAEERLSPSAIKQAMGRKPRAAGAMASMAGSLARPVSKKATTQR